MCKHLKNAKVSAFCLTFSLSKGGNVQYFKPLRLKWPLCGPKGRKIAKKIVNLHVRCIVSAKQRLRIGRRNAVVAVDAA